MSSYPPPKVAITKHAIRRMHDRFQDVLAPYDTDSQILGHLRQVVVAGIQKGRFLNTGVLIDFRGKLGIARVDFDTENNEWKVVTVIDWMSISDNIPDDPCGILKALISVQQKNLERCA